MIGYNTYYFFIQYWYFGIETCTFFFFDHFKNCPYCQASWPCRYNILLHKYIQWYIYNKVISFMCNCFFVFFK